MWEIYGKKLTKSEPIIGTSKAFLDQIIWDGINEKMRLGFFEEKKIATWFAENIKNGTSKKSWLITIEDKLNNLTEEIGYTERDNSHKKVRQYKMDRS